MEMMQVEGITLFAITTSVVYYARYIWNKKMLSTKEVLYRNLPIHTVEGSYTGPMYYLVSIIVLVLGPLSYSVYPVTLTQYLVLNFIAGFIFVYGYSPFAPITGFATLTVYRQQGKTMCLVGNLLGRKYEVLTILKEDGLKVRLKKRNRDFTISARLTPDSSPSA